MVSAIDAPMEYYNNGEQPAGSPTGGLGYVWVRRPMVPFAWTLLADLFVSANLALSPPTPATTSIIPMGSPKVSALSPQGPVTVQPAYLLLTPVAFDGSMSFFSRLGYFSIKSAGVC